MLSVNTVSALPELGLRPAGLGAGPTPAPAAGDDFASLLGRLANNAVTSVQQGEAAAVGGMQGNLPLQTVVDKVMAAERTLQAALAVRDKAVNAYQEISRMQI